MSHMVPVIEPRVLHFSCGHCGVTLSVPVALAGVRGACPGCGQQIEAPAPDDQPPEPAVSGSAAGSDQRCSRRAERAEIIETAEPIPCADSPLGKWVSAALGGLLGGAAVFGSVWMWQLGRDLEAPAESTPLAGVAGGDDLTIEVLAEQRREASRETAALLAAQQTLLRFLRSRSPAEAVTWLDTPTAELDLVEKIIVSSHLEEGVSLERRRRLPEAAGYLSTWRVGEATPAGWRIEVIDVGGTPKIDWAALRSQLEVPPAAVAPTAVATSSGVGS